MEAADTEAIKRLVESGFGYSVLTESALRGQSRFFYTLRVAGHQLTRYQARPAQTLARAMKGATATSRRTRVLMPRGESTI